MTPGTISVVMPAYNAAATLERTYREVPHDIVDEVIVVDNGSTDRTAATAAEHGARVLSEPRRGYGAACLTGIAMRKKGITDGSYHQPLAAAVVGKPLHLEVSDADHDTTPGKDQLDALVLIDPHTHINALSPASENLADILGAVR